MGDAPLPSPPTYTGLKQLRVCGRGGRATIELRDKVGWAGRAAASSTHGAMCPAWVIVLVPRNLFPLCKSGAAVGECAASYPPPPPPPRRVPSAARSCSSHPVNGGRSAQRCHSCLQRSRRATRHCPPCSWEGASQLSFPPPSEHTTRMVHVRLLRPFYSSACSGMQPCTAVPPHPSPPVELQATKVWAPMSMTTLGV